MKFRNSVCVVVVSALFAAGSASSALAQAYEHWSAWEPTDNRLVQYRVSLEGAYVGKIEFKTQARGDAGSTRVEYTIHCDNGSYDQRGAVYVPNEGISPATTFQTCSGKGPDLIQVDIKSHRERD